MKWKGLALLRPHKTGPVGLQPTPPPPLEMLLSEMCIECLLGLIQTARAPAQGCQSVWIEHLPCITLRHSRQAYAQSINLWNLQPVTEGCCHAAFVFN